MKKFCVLTCFMMAGICLFSQELKKLKGDKVKFGKGIMHSEDAYIFEYNNYTYVADADYHIKGEKFHFTIAKFDSRLNAVRKYYYMWKKKSGYRLVNFRLNPKEGYLTFCYCLNEDQTSRIWFQKVRLDKLGFDGEPKLIADFASEEKSYMRDFYSYSSPSEKYMLIRSDIKGLQRQMLFDENNVLLYDNQSDLDGYRMWLDNSGRSIAIKETFDLKDLDTTVKKPLYTKFDIKLVDMDGEEEQAAFYPGINSYSLSYYSYGWGFASGTLNNYGFKLMGNHLYFAAFSRCEDKKFLSSGQSHAGLSNGIYYAMMDIDAGCKVVKSALIPFKEEVSEGLVKKMYSVGPKTSAARVNEFASVVKCEKGELPRIYMDGIMVDSSGNLCVVGSSYTNTFTNIYSESYSETDLNNLYDKRNIQMFIINTETLTLENPGLFVRNSYGRGFYESAVWLKANGNTYYSFYKNFQTKMSPGSFETGDDAWHKFIKSNYGYFTRSRSGRLFYVRTNNIPQAFRLYLITIE